MSTTERIKRVTRVESAIVRTAGHLLERLGGERLECHFVEFEFSFHHPCLGEETDGAECTGIKLN